MSYDPPRSPRHRTTSFRAPAGSSVPPWETETYQGQPGYADAFDGAQGYGTQGHVAQGYGVPAHGGQAGGYSGQAGYQGPGYQEPGYQDHGYQEPGYQGPGYQEPGYQEPGYQDHGYQDPGYQDQGGYYANGGYPDQGGYGYAPAGYAGAQNGYGNYPERADGFDGAPGYSDPRNSGAMLSAPDEGNWANLAQGRAQSRTARLRAPGVIVGAVMGFLAAGVAIGIATLAAAFFRPQASPIIAVGEAFIDRTSPALKNFAVEKFGENDKTMLLLGMYVTIALLAMTIGCLARRRIEIGIVGVAVFGLFGSFVAYTRPASEFTDVIPSIIGGIAGVAALLWLARAGTPEPARAGAAAPRPGYQWSDGGRS